VREAGFPCATCGKQTLHRQATPNHVLHFLITFFTCGLWVIPWLILSNNSSGGPWLCSICGTARLPESGPRPEPIPARPMSLGEKRFYAGTVILPLAIGAGVILWFSVAPYFDRLRHARNFAEFMRASTQGFDRAEGVLSYNRDVDLLLSPDSWASLGVVSPGTPLLIHEERNGLLLIEPLNGNMKGKRGWVSRVYVTRHPSPAPSQLSSSVAARRIIEHSDGLQKTTPPTTAPRAHSQSRQAMPSPVADELSIWLADLKSPGIDNRIAAAQHFGKSGRSASVSQVIEPLVEAMADPEWRVRFTATIALGDIGAPAARALPALQAACADDQGKKIADQACKSAERISRATGIDPAASHQ
jgi:hypothetical protein